MVTAAKFSANSSGSQVFNSSRAYPRRVLTDTGNWPATPALAAAITSRASGGFFISAAPAPCFSIFRSGQPILMSKPSKPSSTIILAAANIFSGLAVNNCATIGRSASVKIRSRSKRSRPRLIKPSAETNSVQSTSGPPYLAMIRRKATSVTSAIGAKQKNGLGNWSQKFFIIQPSAKINY